MTVPPSDIVSSSGVPPFDPDALERSISSRLERVAAAVPERPAVVTLDRLWTYRELLGEVRRRAALADEVPASSTGCGAYLVDHSPEMVFCALGIVASGRAGLGIHPGQPASAQRSILEDAAPELLLTTAGLEARAREITAGTSCRVVRCDESPAVRSGASAFSARSGGDPAALFYTSGSTGRPKGLVKSHRAVLHRAWLAGKVDGVGPADRVSLMTYGSFASSEGDLYGALLHGAALCPFDPAAGGLSRLEEWIGSLGITVLHPPVLLFRRLLQGLDPERTFPSVRLVALAGDVVRPQDLTLWRRHFRADCRLMHRLSTTETGMLAVEPIGPDDPIPTEVIPAGRPVPGKVVEIVDPSGNPVPPGVEGGLRVRSRYLADGYWRRPDGVFPEVSVPGEPPGIREYRTGDRARWLPDGRLVFLGRRDHQVKLRGYRVELGEIEAEIAALPDVRESAVVVDPRDDAGRLVAFVVTGSPGGFREPAIRDRLKERLAEWKIPAEFVRLPSLPVTPTGKVDRRALASSLPPAGPVAVASGVDSREQEMAALWARALGRARVGMHDDFRDLGGHSLQAMQLVRGLERLLGRPVSLAALLANPTVSRFAASLDGDAGAARPGLPGFRGAPAGVPWIHVPGVHGIEFLAPSLAAVIGRHRPYFDGLQFPGLDDAGPRLTRVEAMAASVVSQLGGLYPEGPIVFSGYSFGGLVAYEAARQWTALGREVERVVLLDTTVHGGRRLRSPGEHLSVLVSRFRGLPWRARIRYLASLGTRKLKDWGRKAARRVPFRTSDRRDLLWAAAREAKAAYRPGAFAGPVDLLRAMRPTTADTGRWEYASDNGWGPVWHERFRIHRVDCDHEQLFLEPVAPVVLALVEGFAAPRRRAVGTWTG
ncbi:MAG: AMP-binding protein [Verrucomicrobiae bacterium]|nr:AMP-binding protein [Verrucomicrobiae bacterium]